MPSERRRSLRPGLSFNRQSYDETRSSRHDSDFSPYNDDRNGDDGRCVGTAPTFRCGNRWKVVRCVRRTADNQSQKAAIQRTNSRQRQCTQQMM